MQGRFTIFSLALKNLRRKRIRTVILIIAIALLVSILVFALSFVRRVDSGIKIAAGRLGADLLIVPTGSRGEAEDVLLENRVKSFYMDRDIIERVKKIDGITEITSQIYLTTLVGICCDVPDSIVVAFNQDTDFVIKPWLTKTLNRRLQKGEAIVGSESSFNINMGLIEVDGVLFGNIFHMIGVLDQTGTGLDNAIFIDEENIDAILRKGKANIKPNQISIIFAKIKEGLDPYTVAGRVEDSIIEVDAISRRDIGSKILSTLRDINRIFAITVIFASVLAAFLAWAVFSAVVNERAKEVGIMRAIGAKESQIAGLFLTEILVISLIGSIIGIAAGTSYSFILTKGFSIMKNISTDLSLTERVFIGIFGLLSGTGICIGGAFLPVLKLKKMEPLVVIKGESVQLILKDVTKVYSVDNEILKAVDNVSLEVRKGEFISIVGHSGSGKTTLLSIIGGIIKPLSGSVLFNGNDIYSLNSDKISEYRCEKIGFMFQFASLLPVLTAKENVLLPVIFTDNQRHSSSENDEQKAVELLKMVGLGDKINAYPSQLSGGQQRRVAIARAFINDPELILADEPTGDLDVDTEADMIRFFQRMNEEKGATFIIVTHSTDLARIARQRLRMSNGSLREA